ncbi:MAG: hypothetical protein R2876_05650 [Eubacteriales bacterium]
MKGSFTKEESLILKRFSCDPAYAEYLIRIGRARENGKDLSVQINHIDKSDIVNYENIKKDLNKCKKTLDKLNARLNCIVENNSYSLLTYIELKATLLDIIERLNTTITDNIDPNLTKQKEKLFLLD